MTEEQRIAQRAVYWNAMLEILADWAVRGPLPDEAGPTAIAKDQSERRLMLRYLRLWREACEHPEEMEEAA